ncbi:hypothetical protein [Halalkalibacter urbisdiaboli]|uniref:hypothetical protein n=1 Tax=Halalkalibacter urbisdiaboli TaxID=1960589 RepID=UPI000B44623F|nr:hypothetical protein [Halalkalibacter urbisdiaboli]
MLSIEEYIARRKQEDQLNEFDKDLRSENLHSCVNYVFEYFNNYLDITKLEEQTALKNEKLEKFRRQFNGYADEILDWLVDIYDDHGRQIHMSIKNILKKEELFFLYNKDKEFRSISYDCYAKLINKHPFLKNDTDMLYSFIKNYHQIESEPTVEHKSILISEEISEWVEEAWFKHHVNVMKFAFDWVNRFSDNHELWPAKHRIKSKGTWLDYEYNVKAKSNLFNLDTLYKRMPKKSFIRGKKQAFEVIMMYFWLHKIEGDTDYWEEYVRTFISDD